MATATKGEKDEAKATIPAKSLVWFGTLPASQAVDMRVPTRYQSDITHDYFEIKKQEPDDLWNHPKDARVWIGKCRFYQSLPVRGFNFPAFSEVIERNATNENEMVAMPFPGAVVILKAGEVERIARSAWRHVVRFKAGNGDIYSLKNQGRCDIVDLDLVRKPPSWTQEQWIQERQRIPMEIPAFDPDTDVPVAHFVYLVPLEIEDFGGLFDSRGDLDIGSCVTHLPNQRLDRKFFLSPPRSVAETYPHLKE